MADRSSIVAAVKAKRMKRNGVLQCRVCGWAPPPTLAATIMHGHHIIPVKAGGTNESRNIVVLCPNHHSIAHALFPVAAADQYEGPRTVGDLVSLMRSFETNPEEYYEAKLRLALEDTEKLQAEYDRAVG